jgi:SAM-dependent methyltransferase
MPRDFTDQDLIAIAREYVLNSGNPDMIAYGRGFLDILPRYVKQLRKEAQLVHGPNDRVLDIGCGFGWHAMLLSLMTGAEVVANDVRELMTSTVDERCRALRERNIPVRVTALLADACTARIEGQFDVILCLQTMEHVHDPWAAVRAFATVLKPGGRILITNMNNARSPAVVKETLEMWELRDGSQEFVDGLKRERPLENATAEPYAVMRRRIIRESAPDLNGRELEEMVRATAGLDREQILRAVELFNVGGPLPTPPKLSRCRNPETGEFCERLLDPYELRDMLQNVGIRARVEHRFNRWPLRLFNRVRSRAMHDLLFRLRPGFAITGVRMGGVAERPIAGRTAGGADTRREAGYALSDAERDAERAYN